MLKHVIEKTEVSRFRIIAAAVLMAGVGWVSTPAAAAAADVTHGPVFIQPREASGFCLDADTGAPTSGGDVRLWTCNDQPQQRWYIHDLGGNNVQIENAQTHLMLEARGGQIQQWQNASGNLNHVWHLHDYESNGANLFDTYLRSAGTANQELEAAANPPVVDGAAVGLNSYLEGHNPQRWNIVLGS